MFNSLRVRVFLLHLAASTCLAALVFLLVWFVWYPNALNRITGVLPILAIVMGVDVVLGPALTAVVFRPGKPRLLFDIGLIISVQVFAFCYGVWAISEARPVWIVFTGYRFDLVQANDVDKRFEADISREYKKPSWLGPRWVAAELPSDVNRRNQLIFESLGGGAGMSHRPDLYVPLERVNEKLKSRAISLDELASIHGEEAVSALKRRWPLATGYFPMAARQGYFVVLVNRDQAKVVEIFDLKPFK